MPGEQTKREARLETFKTFSTFLSSVVIALATFLATREYNSQQLEISRNKALSELIPKLGDIDPNVRKFSAVSLALYGKNAVPALLATLNDEKQAVRHAAATSLGIIGTSAAADLMKVYSDKLRDHSVRAGVLYALGLMRHEPAAELAIAALLDKGEDAGVRIDAAEVLGMLRNKKGVKALLSVLKYDAEADTLLVRNSLEALSKIKDVSETREIRNLLFDSHPNIRLWALWTVKEIGDTSAIGDLLRIESDEKKSEYERLRAQEVLTQLEARK